MSVALATFNGAAHLREQLDTIRSQTLPPREIVVSDDGSTDGTLDVVAQFASQADLSVRVVQNPVRLGFRGNFLQAAEQCQGDLIAFCDQDDVWEREKLEAAAGMFTDEGTLLVHHNAIVTDATGAALGTLHQWRKPVARMSANSEDPWRISHGFTQMFRRTLCAFNRLWPLSLDPDRPDSQMAHDQWMFFLATSLGGTAYIDRPLARYRQHVSNAAGWTPTVSVARRAAMQFENRTEVYARCRDAAAQRCKILSDIEESAASAAFKANAGLARQRYETLQALYTSRHGLYQSASFGQRLVRFRDLLRRGAYGRSGPFTFTRKGALKDAALGLAFGNLMRRFGSAASGGDPTCRATS